MTGLEEFVGALSKAEGNTSGGFQAGTPKRRLLVANLLHLYVGRFSVSKTLRKVIGFPYCANISSCLLMCKCFILSLESRRRTGMKHRSLSVFVLSGPFGACYHVRTFPCSLFSPSGSRALLTVNWRGVKTQTCSRFPIAWQSISF